MNMNCGFTSPNMRMVMPKIIMKPGASIAARMLAKSLPMKPKAIAAQRGQGSEAHGATGTGHPAEPKTCVAAPSSVKTLAAAPQALSPEEQERQRIADIDSIASVINDTEMVNEAKYGDARRGIAPYSAQELAFKAAQRKIESLAYSDIDTAICAAKGCANNPEARMAAGRRIARSVLEADVDAGVQAAKGFTSDQRARFEEGRRTARAFANIDAEAQATK